MKVSYFRKPTQTCLREEQKLEATAKAQGGFIAITERMLGACFIVHGSWLKLSHLNLFRAEREWAFSEKHVLDLLFSFWRPEGTQIRQTGAVLSFAGAWATSVFCLA